METVSTCGRIYNRADYLALKAIPFFKSDDRRAADSAREVVAFGRRIFDPKK